MKHQPRHEDHENVYLQHVVTWRGDHCAVFRRRDSGSFLADVVLTPASKRLIVTGDGPDFIIRTNCSTLRGAILWAASSSRSPMYFHSKILIGEKQSFHYDLVRPDVVQFYRECEIDLPGDIADCLEHDVTEEMSQQEVARVLYDANVDPEIIGDIGMRASTDFLNVCNMFRALGHAVEMENHWARGHDSQAARAYRGEGTA